VDAVPTRLERIGWAVLLAVALVLAGWASAASAQIPAFPGAEGYGMWSQGGRGGDVYRVTTLADYGEGEAPIPGSLREAVEAEGARTVVFRVAGTIRLVRRLEVQNPFLTIAGQSAPGEGVALADYGVDVAAPEVVIRHLRVRPGDRAGEEQDAITVRRGPAIIDHCSVSWATDETLSVIHAATAVTVQRCLIAESLNRSVHHKGAHGYGTLITATGDVSIHHSVYAFHESRNPRPKDVRLDFRHNLVVGWGDQPGYTYEDFLQMNHVGNGFEPRAYSTTPECAFNVGGANARIYAAGNLRLDAPAGWDDEGLCASRGYGPEIFEAVRVGTPFPAPAVTPTPVEDLKAELSATVGATRPVRDAVDRRVLGLIERGEGGIIDSQADVGGWPALASADPPADDDADGMPDAWERAHGLDPSDGDDHRADADGDGYTNLEEWLNETDPRDPARWIPPPTFAPAPGTPFTDSLVVTVEAGAWPAHVTRDGTEPTAASPRAAGPITLTETAHLRARVTEPGAATATAVALYPRLDWRPASPPAGRTLPGLAAAVYESDDWDEGPQPEALDPVRRGVEADVDAVLARDEVDGVVLSGWLEVPTDGIYTFWLSDHPRSRLLIGGEAVSPGMPSGVRPAQLALRAGLHRFGLRSLHEHPQRDASLTWAGPGFDRQPIDPALLSHSPSDL
jgi:hypothetical protein